MPMSPHIKEQIVDELLQGSSVKEIAVKYNKPSGLIQNIRKEVLETSDNEAIDILAQADISVVKSVAKTVVENFPATADKMNELTKGVHALQKLQPELLEAMSEVVKKATDHLKSDDFKIKDLPMITRALVDMNVAVYNPNVTNNLVQVNTTTTTTKEETKATLLQMRQSLIEEKQDD